MNIFSGVSKLYCRHKETSCSDALFEVCYLFCTTEHSTVPPTAVSVHVRTFDGGGPTEQVLIRFDNMNSRPWSSNLSFLHTWQQLGTKSVCFCVCHCHCQKKLGFHGKPQKWLFVMSCCRPCCRWRQSISTHELIGKWENRPILRQGAGSLAALLFCHTVYCILETHR